MKKFTTKLLMSIIAVAFAFVALGTSTYAWFSMNTQVTVTGMEIGAKSENTFLLIGTGDNDTPAEIWTGSPTTVSLAPANNENTTVLPSKPLESSEIGSGKLFETGTPVTNAATAAVEANWYTAQNNDPASATNSIKNQNKLGTDDTTDSNYVAAYAFSKYVIKKTVYLTLAQGSDSAHNLTVTPTIAVRTGESGTDITGVKVLVATGANCVILNSGMTTAQSLHATDFTITDQAAVQVDIYIYYDGSETNVYTNNSANLAAATINLAFDVELGSAN